MDRNRQYALQTLIFTDINVMDIIFTDIIIHTTAPVIMMSVIIMSDNVGFNLKLNKKYSLCLRYCT